MSGLYCGEKALWYNHKFFQVLLFSVPTVLSVSSGATVNLDMEVIEVGFYCIFFIGTIILKVQLIE